MCRHLVLELSLVWEPVSHPGPVEAAITAGHSPGLGLSVVETVVETRGANSAVRDCRIAVNMVSVLASILKL